MAPTIALLPPVKYARIIIASVIAATMINMTTAILPFLAPPGLSYFDCFLAINRLFLQNYLLFQLNIFAITK